MEDKENRPGPGAYNTNYIDQDAICKGAAQSKNSKINAKWASYDTLLNILNLLMNLQMANMI